MSKSLALAFLLASTVGTEATDPFPTTLGDSTYNVGIPIFDGLFISEATIPFDVYMHVSGKRMNTYFVGETLNPVHTHYGTRLKPHYTVDTAPAADILVVPSGIGSHSSFLKKWYQGTTAPDGTVTGKTTKGNSVTYYKQMTKLINWVNSTARSAKLVTSHCWGAFTLADVGVLDGKTVTTFPGYTQDLETNYPKIGKTVSDQRFVVDGKIITSNGGLAAFEACLYVVRKLYGDSEAQKKVVEGLVYSTDNVGHSKLQFYKTSPVKSGNAPGDPAGVSLPVKVGILLTDGAFISEPAAPFDVLAHESKRMQVFFVAADMNPKTSHYGGVMYPDYTFATAPTVDVLVVPSGIGSHHSFLTSWYSGTNATGKVIGKTTTGVSVTYYGDQKDLIDWVKKAAASAKYVTSHCWGAFTLGDAGLLDGKYATTFPGYTDTLKKYYPKIKGTITSARIAVDGKLITSNGGVAAYEAANYVLRAYFGDYFARNLATNLAYAADNYAAMDSAWVNGKSPTEASMGSSLKPISALFAFVWVSLLI